MITFVDLTLRYVIIKFDTAGIYVHKPYKKHAVA